MTSGADTPPLPCPSCEQVRRAGVEADARAQRAEAALAHERRARGRQSAVVELLGHELKNSLTVMRLELGAVREPHPVTTRLAAMVTDLVSVIDRFAPSDARVADALQPQWSRIDLRQELATLVRSCPADVRLAPGPPGPMLDTDPALWRVVMSNLLGNALKYGEPSRGVDLVCTPDPRVAGVGVAVSVSSAPGAAGLPDEQRVFDRHYRGPGVAGMPGDGLGLYLSARIAAILGGDLSYAARDGRAVFTLWLPA